MDFPINFQGNPPSLSPIDLQYDFIDMVGKGTYGTAWIAKDRLNGKKVIVKAIKKINTSKSVFAKEYKYSLCLSLHPFIITTFKNAYETSKYFVMVQEFAPCGDLFDAIVPEQGMFEDDAKHTIKQISEALNFMHSKHLVHRDVKPENIVVMDKSQKDVKLIDFGMTLRAGTHVARVCGSIPYTPPEICQASLSDGFYVDTGNDVWSLGVLLFCMLTGTFPWEQASPNDIHYKDFIDWQLSFSPEVAVLWRKFSPEALTIFQKMLNLDIRKRCKVIELQNYLHFQWLESKDIFQDTSSEISSLCRTPNPERVVDHDDTHTHDIHYVHDASFLNENQVTSHRPIDLLSFENVIEKEKYFKVHHDARETSTVSNNSSSVDHSHIPRSHPNYFSKDCYSITTSQGENFAGSVLETNGSNFNPAAVSPGHSHHFSDVVIVPESSKMLNSSSTYKGYHLRGSSVTHNITVC